MNVVVNGATRDVPRGVSIAEVLRLFDVGDESRGVAAARNGVLVLRSRWDDTELTEGDSIEVLEAVQGG